MIALLFALVVGQSPCGDSAARIAAATERAAVLDLRGASTQLAGDSPCAAVAVASWYLRGLIAAREAYSYGGSPESLQPVRVAIEQLASRGAEGASAEIARVVLMAASSAAQSEREEMGLLLEHALDLERKQRAAGLPGAPVVTAHEVAGDLWLQVHRFEDARRAYLSASDQIGPTRRIALGLARASSRLGDVPVACERYQAFVIGWPTAEKDPSELAEARTFLKRPECRTGSAPRK